MALIRDEETGELRPYDPDRDGDKPARLFGSLPPDNGSAKATPLNPLHDLR